MVTPFDKIYFDLTAFQRAIEAKRSGLGVSRRMLMASLGLSHSTYTRMMRGHEPSPTTLLRFLAWLDVQDVREFMKAGA